MVPIVTSINSLDRESDFRYSYGHAITATRRMNSTSVYASPYEPDPDLVYLAQGDVHHMDGPISSDSSSPEVNSIRDGSSTSPEVASVKMTAPIHVDDNEPVYANLAEFGTGNAAPLIESPKPSEGDQQRRVLPHGWTEYISRSGRSYFFNSETGRCQWIPPRLMRSPSQIKAFLDATKHLEGALPSQKSLDEENFDSVASTDSDNEAVESVTSRATSLEPQNIPSSDELISSTEYSRNDPFNNQEIFNNLPPLPSIPTSANRPPSLVIKNRGSLKQVHVPQLPISAMSASVPSASEVPEYDAPAPSSSCYSFRDEMLLYNEVPKPVKQGYMERVVAEKAKKREWSPCYFFLSTAHLLVYKDEKSAEKQGRHYEAPLFGMELRGASVSWVVEKERRKRRIFQLNSAPGNSALSTAPPLILRSSTDALTEQWFDSIREVIAHLPAHTNDTTASISTIPISVIRNPSAMPPRPSSTYNVLTKSIRREHKPDPMSSSVYEVSSAGSSTFYHPGSGVCHDPPPSRESILEKLRRFFRSRPSVESLKEKGIYKPEPVFGSTLPVICQLENTLVPRFIQVVTELIEAKGLEVDGLYRVSGNLSSVQKIRCQVDQNRYQLLVAEEDIHVLTGALKLFFRELAEPVFPIKMHKDFLSAMQQAKSSHRQRRFDELIKLLPIENRETLKLLLRHLNTVAKNADKNRMQTHNLAIMFGPTLFQSGAEDRSATAKKNKDKKKKGKEENVAVQSNSHLAFHMIMQGQIVEYLLNEGKNLEALQGPVRLHP
ncbi:unnamed protein product, partial [Mesorhabditis belari]|uniref:Rho GTPase activating protein n=1 Tax=Mesorhabditis belari TaxID=2138241 RepID=A0AAF3EEQ8_9BILA